jgi:hypothetical protein
MCDNLNHFTIIHYNEVIEIERQGRLSPDVHHERPDLKDLLYLRLGNWMVDLGSRLRSASNFSKQSPLSEMTNEAS